MITKDDIRVVRYFKGGKGRFSNWFVLADLRDNRLSAIARREMINFFNQQFGKVGVGWDFDYSRSSTSQWLIKIDKDSDATLFSLKYRGI
jgi:hypothetical protein